MVDVLLLNADYSPLKILAWQRAVCLVLEDKVGVVTSYEDRVVRSPTREVPWPAVVALRRYARHQDRIAFSRMNVLARDGARCQYCGLVPRTPRGRLKLEELTLDHVVPRAQSRNGKVTLPWNGRRVWVSCWENVVTACAPCNRQKADRTPAEAGLTLRQLPVKPTSRHALAVTFARARIPDEWRDFLPEDVLRLTA